VRRCHGEGKQQPSHRLVRRSRFPSAVGYPEPCIEQGSQLLQVLAELTSSRLCNLGVAWCALRGVGLHQCVKCMDACVISCFHFFVPRASNRPVRQCEPSVLCTGCTGTLSCCSFCVRRTIEHVRRTKTISGTSCSRLPTRPHATVAPADAPSALDPLANAVGDRLPPHRTPARGPSRPGGAALPSLRIRAACGRLAAGGRRLHVARLSSLRREGGCPNCCHRKLFR